MSENCGISKISDANALDDEHSEMELLQFTREQYDFIQKQNFQLLQDLDKVEEEATQIHTQRIVLENENRLLKEDIIHTQQRARVAEIVLEEEKQKVRDQEQKLKIMAGQNAELLRLLDAEETQGANSAKISIEALHELGTLKEKYENLLAISSKNKELADHAAKKEELKTEEVRILRMELDQFQSVCLDLRIKMQVEVESLEEQLRARKEKQCVLLEQIQNLSKDSKALQNQVNELEETIRTNNVKTAELESQLQVALQSRNLTEENLKISKTESSLACQTIAGLQQKLQQAEMQRLHRDSEVQNSNEQLREMAEKVFQLLERLKLAEMAKTKAIEAMQRKEKEQVVWKKKATRLEIDSNKEGKAHYKVELDLQAALEQVLALKRHNLQLEKKFNEQSKEQIGKQAELTDARDKICSLEGRLSFVVNKMKLEEEARVVKSVEKKDLELQVKELTARIAELQLKLSEAGDSNRALFERIQLKEGEIEKMALLQTSSSMSNSSTQDMYGKGYVESGADGSTCTDDSIKLMQDSSDLKMVKISGGKGLFYTESKASQGIILVRCRAESYRGWLEKTNLNNFLKKAQRSNRFKETIIDKLCQVYALLLVEQEEKSNTKSELIACNNQITSLAQTNGYLVDRLSCEIDAKYKTILRYVHAVKIGSSSNSETMTGIIQLPRSGITDEEMHAIAALLRNNLIVTELNLSNNAVTDEGVRSLANVLSGPNSLREVDLRANAISKQGISILVGALRCNEKVQHVYAHHNGKIEALGGGLWASPRISTSGCSDSGTVKIDQSLALASMETICVIDVRENVSPHKEYGSELSNSEFAGFGLSDCTSLNLGEEKKIQKCKMVKKGKKGESIEHERPEWLGRNGGFETGQRDVTILSSRPGQERPSRNSLPDIQTRSSSADKLSKTLMNNPFALSAVKTSNHRGQKSPQNK